MREISCGSSCDKQASAGNVFNIPEKTEIQYLENKKKFTSQMWQSIAVQDLLSFTFGSRSIDKIQLAAPIVG